MIKSFQYKPLGVCAKNIIFTADENNIIKDLRIIGGCSGYSKAITALVKEENIDTIINKLEGIQCGIKGTSCADQIASALKLFIKKQRDN